MSQDYLEVEEVKVNNMQVYQQDKAVIDMQISTAKQYPRQLSNCISNAITIATLDGKTAQSCMYSLNKGGKNITGPSVVLAKILAQSMGNMRIENRVVGFDGTHVTCEAVCFDLESNFAIRTQIKKSITGKSGTFSEDMQVIISNAGNSIALRNAIFAVIPKSIIDKVYNAALSVVTGDISDETKLTAKRTKVFNGFKDAYNEQKLTDIEICKAVGKESVANITGEDLVTLIGFQNSLKSGEMQFTSIFRPQINMTTAPISSKEKETERLLVLINASSSKATLEKLVKNLSTNEERIAYDDKMKTFK